MSQNEDNYDEAESESELNISSASLENEEEHDASSNTIARFQEFHDEIVEATQNLSGIEARANQLGVGLHLDNANIKLTHDRLQEMINCVQEMIAAPNGK